MRKVGAAMEKARARLNAKASKFMPGTCSLIPQVKGDDGHSGHKMVDGTAIPNIPCRVEFVSGGFQVNDGGSVVIKTHRITMPVTADTVAIKKSYKISVAGEGLTPAMVFEQPVVQLGHLDAFLVVGASFAEGFRQPAAT